MPEFKRIRQRTTNSERIRTGVAQVEPNELVITTDSNELYFKNQQGEFIRVSESNTIFPSIDSLVNSTNNLKLGDVVDLQGHYEAGDGESHKRRIEGIDSGDGVQLANGLWANVVANSYGVDKGVGETLSKELVKVKTDVHHIFGAEVSGFIQDEGLKHVNELYVDKNTNQVYRCRVSTFDTINTAANFEPKSLVNPTDLSWKLIPNSEKWIFDADTINPGMEIYYDANELMFVIENPGIGGRQCHVILNSAARGNKVYCRVNEKPRGQFCVEGREDYRDYVVSPGTDLSDVSLKGVYWR